MSRHSRNGVGEEFGEKLVRSSKQLPPCDRKPFTNTPVTFPPGVLGARLLNRLPAHHRRLSEEATQRPRGDIWWLATEVDGEKLPLLPTPRFGWEV